MDGPGRRQRVVGAVLGSAVGDALGAPFEFGPAGMSGARFPGPAAMCGGGAGRGWAPLSRRGRQVVRTRAALWPPKPKELVRAAPAGSGPEAVSRSRGWRSGSGSVRLRTAGAYWWCSE